MKYIKIIITIATLLPITLVSKLVEYDLTINYKTVNYTGKNRKAMVINNQIPAPTIEATVGDTLRVTFHNNMDVETSVHWHGILLPNDQDGVPYLTTPPIKAHSSLTYEYPITHSGTYWYHSHTKLQEQRGLYGALVFHPKEHEHIQTDHDYVIVLSDWTDEDPHTVWSNVKRDGDYYMLKKGTVQSWLGVLLNGSKAIKTRMNLLWNRMGAMDISDFGFDAFLANGSKKNHVHAQPGETIRFRIINAASATYFNLEFSGSPMKIINLDGIDVEPFTTQRFLIAIAETYDIVVTVPNDHNAYELRASSEDGMGYSSTIIGNGSTQSAPTIPKPNLYLRSMHHNHNTDPTKHKASQNKSHGNHNTKSHHIKKKKQHNNTTAHMQDHTKSSVVTAPSIIDYKDNYDGIKSQHPTKFSSQVPVREITLHLTGNMERYQWGMNNRPLSEVDQIYIKKGEVVRFKMINKTMMHHPMHLHGHFFRVLNDQGDYSPLKHTVNVPAMDQVTIEFLASENKDWFFHCHNLYHMISGLARVVSYKDSTQYTHKTKQHLAHDRKWFFFTDNTFASNMMFGFGRLWNMRNSFEIEYDFNYKKEFDVDALYRRNITRYIDIYAGGNFERECPNERTRKAIVFGIEVVLPLWITADIRADSKAHVYIELRSSIQLTNRLFFEWEVNSDKEYRTTFSYEFTKDILATITHDSEFHFGGGIRFRFS